MFFSLLDPSSRDSSADFAESFIPKVLEVIGWLAIAAITGITIFLCFYSNSPVLLWIWFGGLFIYSVTLIKDTSKGIRASFLNGYRRGARMIGLCIGLYLLTQLSVFVIGFFLRLF